MPCNAFQVALTVALSALPVVGLTALSKSDVGVEVQVIMIVLLTRVHHRSRGLSFIVKSPSLPVFSKAIDDDVTF